MDDTASTRVRSESHSIQIQNCMQPMGGANRHLLCRVLLYGLWKCQIEGATLAGTAFHPNSTCMPFDHLLGK